MNDSCQVQQGPRTNSRGLEWERGLPCLYLSALISATVESRFFQVWQRSLEFKLRSGYRCLALIWRETDIHIGLKDRNCSLWLSDVTGIPSKGWLQCAVQGALGLLVLLTPSLLCLLALQLGHGETSCSSRWKVCFLALCVLVSESAFVCVSFQKHLGCFFTMCPL